jgi:hypothetical protein
MLERSNYLHSEPNYAPHSYNYPRKLLSISEDFTIINKSCWCHCSGTYIFYQGVVSEVPWVNNKKLFQILEANYRNNST